MFSYIIGIGQSQQKIIILKALGKKLNEKQKLLKSTKIK